MEEIIEKLSIKYNLPKVAIEAICESPFRMLVENMRDRKLDTFHFSGLGKFAIHPNKVKWIKENILERVLQQDVIRREYKRNQHKERREAGLRDDSKAHSFGMDKQDSGLDESAGT